MAIHGALRRSTARRRSGIQGADQFYVMDEPDFHGARAALSLAVDDDRITRIYAIVNPNKLNCLDQVADVRR
jgi:hypothetical protein